MPNHLCGLESWGYRKTRENTPRKKEAGSRVGSECKPRNTDRVWSMAVVRGRAGPQAFES